ncbi:MAG: WGR domain-containing protein [Candidatus Thorarchaeota archaeon]
MTENGTTSIRYEDSDQFWSGEVHGKFVNLHFGKKGTKGHKATREFRSQREAERFLEERLADKIKEGFVPV